MNPRRGFGRSESEGNAVERRPAGRAQASKSLRPQKKGVFGRRRFDRNNLNSVMIIRLRQNTGRAFFLSKERETLILKVRKKLLFLKSGKFLMKKFVFVLLCGGIGLYAESAFAKAQCPMGMTQEQCCSSNGTLTIDAASALCGSQATIKGVYYAGCAKCPAGFEEGGSSSSPSSSATALSCKYPLTLSSDGCCCGK